MTDAPVPRDHARLRQARARGKVRGVSDGAPTGRILLVDDDPALLESLRLFLESEGHRVHVAETLDDGLRLAATLPLQVCLLDRNLGMDSGVDALPRLLELAPRLRVVMLTAHGRVEDAIEAMARGASDYLVKPCSPAQLRVAVARQLDTGRLIDRIAALESQQDADPPELASANPAMQAVLAMARQVAATDANVLLLGESGTGKGVLARAIHRWSPRAAAPMATVHCPSLSPELLESELFGHARGAFTGAAQSTPGRVGHAEGGTLLLDEIGDFPLALQPKLLRFIEDKAYERVGDPVTRRADVRLVAATNHDLAAQVAEGRFRGDLYYRLNVVSLALPPLRERPEDIDALAEGFLARFARRHGRPARRFAPAAAAALRAYAWPGNVRELQNVVERAVILCPDAQVGTAWLQLGVAGAAPSAPAVAPGAAVTLDELERAHIAAVLAQAPTLEEAARTLGIDASTLWRKRKALGL
ncbi:sigma-54-dependent transcriptional regulator [Arenimonas sp.]|uniref:sigma-54-dependent transcriptional regulator n=1 Tax=Arenimonas sp. TaxID=1872635 RepID=UPI0035B45068